MKTILRAVVAAALLLTTTGHATRAADTFLVELHGVYLDKRGGGPADMWVNLTQRLIEAEAPASGVIGGFTITGPSTKFVDLRGFTAFRYQVQGATCNRDETLCSSSSPAGDSIVMLKASFDDGTTWQPLGNGSAVIRLTPRSLHYRPALKPTGMIMLPIAQRKNNVMLRSVIDQEYEQRTTIGTATVQFYR